MSGPCWICQEPFAGSNAVRIGEQMIECCRGCWKRIPEADRLAVAAKLADLTGAAETHERFRELIEAAISGWISTTFPEGFSGRN